MKASRTAQSVVVLSCTALLLGGCATTAGKVKLQSVRVSVVNERGADLGAARCQLRNASGEWQLAAPGLATVSVDAEPLRIRCTSEDGSQSGEARLERRNTTGRNMLIGAGAGLLVGGAIGESQRRKDSHSKNIGDQIFAPLGLIAGLLFGSLIGSGAGAASGDDGYADAVRVTLKPLPKPTSSSASSPTT
ncbi:hypothetical protein ACG04R_15410 [Roseateles sp. BYS78W]|uniref:Lipoprotein n=1 Tax=Pelomonas candidula TaxID=3299025 RepID=A0ABW7HDR2_9BURK